MRNWVMAGIGLSIWALIMCFLDKWNFHDAGLMVWVFLAIGFLIGGSVAWREAIGKLKSLEVDLKAKQEMQEFENEAKKKLKRH